MIDLTKLRKGKTPRPPRVVVYGRHGVGKTTFANEAGAVIVPTEDGLTNIDVAAGAFPLCQSLDDVFGALQSLAEQEHSIPAVAIDTIDWLERLIFKSVCEKDGAKTIEKAHGGYGKGYVAAMEEWHRLFQALDYLRNEKNMAVILCAHCRVVEYQNPMGEPYDRYQLDLHQSKRISAPARVMEWADAVLFASYKETTRSVTGSDKKRGFGSGERVMFTEERPAFQAKNRYGLPTEMPFSWSALMEEMSR